MRLRDSLLAVAALVGVPAHAQTAPPEATVLRYDEDWSILANQDLTSIQRLKYVPLSDDGMVYLTTGIELRARYEGYRDNLVDEGDPVSDGYVWLRTLPYADLHAGPVRAFVQPIFATAIGIDGGSGPVDRTGFDLLQGFAELTIERASVRLGRQLVSLGSERLIGTRFGPNVPRAFDAVRLDYVAGQAKITALVARPVTAGPGTFDDARDPAKSVRAIYAIVPAGPGKVDLYLIDYRNAAARFDSGSGREHRQTAGVRLFGSQGSTRWNVEAMAQRGTFAGRSIRAWSLASDFSRRFSALPLTPTVEIKANVASGNESSRSGRLGTFNAMFPKGQYFGELTPIGPYNIVNVSGSVLLEPAPSLTVGLAASAYWRESTSDGVYNVPGHLLRSGDASIARHIGNQIEATAEWHATSRVAVSASLSAFKPGRFLVEAGAPHTIGMAAVETEFVF